MNTGKLMLGCLALVGLALLGAQDVRSADEKDAYTITIKSVEVQTTNKDGKAWDINDGKPDLAVTVRNVDDKDQKTFRTKTKDDVYKADFDEKASVKVRVGQTIEFKVLDKDVAVDDTIGVIEKKMTAELLKAGTLKMEKFDRVITLTVELKKE